MSLAYGERKIRHSDVGTKRNQAEFKSSFHIHPSSLLGKKNRCRAAAVNYVVLKEWKTSRRKRRRILTT